MSKVRTPPINYPFVWQIVTANVFVSLGVLLIGTALGRGVQGIPVVGAIMLSPGMDKCLLVRGWGPGASWGFPRGKVNEAEADAACAIREVRHHLLVIQLCCSCE